MRYSIGEKSYVCASLALFFFIIQDSAVAQGISNHERVCAEIGFKPKTIAFGECVLELDRREKADNRAVNQQKVPKPLIEYSTSAQQTFEQAEDNRACRSLGFTSNSPNLAECRLKLQKLREENTRRQQNYERELAEHESRVAAIEKDRDRERALRQIEFGVRVLGGQTPSDASRSLGNSLPTPPARPQALNQTIFLPGGRVVNCSMNGNIINCF